MNNLHGILFAYRSNPALRELTTTRTISSIPFGGRYRIIDFMLSNLVNAGVTDVGVIMHQNYQSLLDHLGSGKDWDLSRKHGGLKLLPPFAFAQRSHQGAFRGKMEALDGVYTYLKQIRQEYVMLADGDVAVNLPVRDILRSHIDSGADITAVCTSHPTGAPRQSTYLTAGSDGRVADVSCAPNAPVGCESLNVYILSRDLLLSLTEHCAAHNIYSFSSGVLLGMKDTLNIRLWLFDGYAARIQSVDAYFTRSMELLEPEVREALFVPQRPIRTKDRSDPSTYYGPDARSVHSLVADGCVIEGHVENSILFRGVRVGRGAVVKNCVLMQSAVIGNGAEVSYVIADKNVQISPNRTLMGHQSYPLAIAKLSVV